MEAHPPYVGRAITTDYWGAIFYPQIVLATWHIRSKIKG